MGGAVCLTYVSYFEGFGMPIIEAMRSGTPVITSNCTAIPEIAGNAALLIDPFNTAEITNAMVNIYSKKELRDELIKKGLKQSDKFSWDKSAERTWEVIQNTVTDAPSIS
jgi:glycosyltransferase involved in cell wall biosynthesis